MTPARTPLPSCHWFSRLAAAPAPGPHRDDAQTNLLVKSELHARLSTGGELTSEQTWGDYQTIDGIAVPHRVTHAVKDRAGSTFERVYSDFQFADTLDPHLFEAP